MPGIKQDYPQDFLIEKLHVDAGAINGVRTIEDPGTRMLTLCNIRHCQRGNQRLGLTAREELKQLLKRSPGQPGRALQKRPFAASGTR